MNGSLYAVGISALSTHTGLMQKRREELSAQGFLA